MDFIHKLNPAIVVPVVCILAGFIVSYILKYCRPYLKITKEIEAMLAGIDKVKSTESFLPDDFRQAVFNKEPYAHLWSEYQDTLHLMQATDGTIDSVRATVPAEIYFSNSSLIDIPLNADFFKHLPGILTGVGIIGTFSGLVWGLINFDVTQANPTTQLGGLFIEVTSAFLGSGIAILAAIAITVHEKYALNKGYKLVEKLNCAIDKLYNTGAGEEYLARLVDASEKGSTHMAALKDALIEDLAKLMNEVAERQIAAQQASGQNLAGQISDAIRGGLAEPMRELMGVVKGVSQGQGESVSHLLEQLLTAFMGKLDDTFGRQMQGIHEALQQSSVMMRDVQTALSKLVTDISGAGVSATEQMSGKLEEAMGRAATAQETMNEQMRQFVTEIRRLIEEQQAQTQSALKLASEEMTGMLKQSLATLAEDRGTQLAQDKARNAEISDKTEGVFNGLTDNVSRLLENMESVAAQSRENIDAIKETTLRAINDMNGGAATMREAAERFATAGSAVSGTLDQTREIAQKMGETTVTLHTAATAVQQAFTQYDQARGSTQAYVLQLQALVETAKKEAGLSQQLVNDLERITRSLGETEQHSLEYLQSVNNVLEKTFKTFGTEMSGQVMRLGEQSNKHVGDSLNSLGAAVDSIVSQVSRLRKSA